MATYDEHPLTLGGEYENEQLNYYFPGFIDEFSLYSRDLSPAEILALAKAWGEGKCAVNRDLQCAPKYASMVGWWTGDGSGSNAISTFSTALNGTTFAAGKVAQAFRFDGKTNRLDIHENNPDFGLTGDFTMEAWIRPTQISGDQRTIFSKRSADNNFVTYVLFLEADGRLAFSSRSYGGTFNTVQTAEKVPINQFTHIAATLEGANLLLYIDGYPVQGDNYPFPRINSAGPLTIGAAVIADNSAAGPFAGIMDELSLYKTALSSAEILAIYRAGRAGKCDAAAMEPLVVRNIHGRANIFGAGHSELPTSVPGEGGFAPALYQFAPGTGQTLSFLNVEGSVSLNVGSLPFFGPDGGSVVAPTDIFPTNGISGIKHPNTAMLVGVFLTDSGTLDPAPATLDFGGSALGTDFAALSPLIGQIFFIGDGKTGSGMPHKFIVPAIATRLYLGIADGWNNTCVCGPTHAYSDNGGTFQASFKISTPKDPCSEIPSGLISFWGADGNALDSGMGNHGRLDGGTTFVPGVDSAGSAFHFDGINDAVIIDNNSFLQPTNVTVAARVRFSSLDSSVASEAGLQYLVFKQNTRNLNFEGYALLKLRAGGVDRFIFAVMYAEGAVAFAESGQIQAGRWYHVAGTYDGKNIRLFVDGAQVSSNPAIIQMNAGSQPLYFGTSGYAPFDGRLNGDLDDVALFNRALSAEEVAHGYLAGKLSECGPLPHVEPFVYGQVVDEQNQPVPGVKVVRYKFGGQKQLISNAANTVLGTTVTDINGMFRFDGLLPEELAVLNAQYDVNGNGIVNDGRYFVPSFQYVKASATDNFARFQLQTGTDFTAPTITVTRPDPLGPSESQSLALRGLITDSGGSKVEDGFLMVIGISPWDGFKYLYDWSRRGFSLSTRASPERLNNPGPEFLKFVEEDDNGEISAIHENLFFAPGTYEARIFAADGAGNVARRDVKFKIVPYVQTFSQSGTVDLPPLPADLPPLRVEATGGADVVVKPVEDRVLNSLDLAASSDSKLTLKVEEDRKLTTDNGITLGVNTVLAVEGEIVSDVSNLEGALIHELIAEGLPAFAAEEPGKNALLANVIPGKNLGDMGPGELQPPSFSRLRSSIAGPDLTGLMQIDGNYQQGAGGKLAIAIMGTNFLTAGAREYDRLLVTGTAELNGTIAVGFLDPTDPTNNPSPFQPVFGTSFDIVVASNIVVGDLTVLVPVWGAGLSFDWGIIDLPDGRQSLRLIVAKTTPILGIESGVTGSLEVFYPPAYDGYRLESTTNLTTGSWNEVGRGTNIFQVQGVESIRFFRATKN